MGNIFINTIIREEKPTLNKRIYEIGSLQKIKEKLQDRINKKVCFVTIGHNPNQAETLIKQGDVAGYLIDFKINDGVGTVEIEPELSTLHGQILKTYFDSHLELGADFRLQTTLTEKTDDNGNSYVNMEDFNVEDTVAVILNESKD